MLAVVAMAVAAPTAAQGFHEPDVAYTLAAEAGVSVRDLGGLRLGQDILTYTGRVTRTPERGLGVWVDAGTFVRPDFACTEGLPCNDGGWLARLGVVASGASDPDATGMQLALRAGMGTTVSDETLLTYLIGFGLRYRFPIPVAPFAELRWEHVARINLTMLALGLSLEL